MSDSTDRRASPAQEVMIDANHDGQRIDNFLFTRLKAVPKSHIYRLLRTGQVRINGRRAKPEQRLVDGDRIRIPPLRMGEPRRAGQPPAALCAQLEAAVLHADKGLLVINKPSGLAVHGGSGLSFGVIEVLRALYPQAPFLELVHRLDRETSGCLLVARKRSALRALHEQLRSGTGVDKRYLALVLGRWPRRLTRVDAALEKNVLRSGERMVSVSEEGRGSATEFRIVEQFSDTTLVEARPLTGRTHQIRVHAAHAGHPIAGDPKYGTEAANKALRTLGLKRLFLHAAQLTFLNPETHAPLKVAAPLPPELERVLATLRAAS